MIGIISAMEIEAERIKGAVQGAKTRTISGIEFVSGKLCAQDVVVAVCGIGKVFAAICAQVMILEYKPDIILNTGVAGALSSTLSIGDIAIAESVVQHDMDTSPLGDPPGFLSGIDCVELPCSEMIADMFVRICSGIKGIRCETGVIASGDQFIGSAERKKQIRKAFHAIAVEMEGAAIGQVCHINNVGFGVLRAISDTADDSSHMEYTSFLKLAATTSCLMVERFLLEWNQESYRADVARR